MERDVGAFSAIVSDAISTHTLTWSVTNRLTGNVANNINFNSHAHVERDLATAVAMVTRCHFNSHAHVERDAVGRQCRLVFFISTHTLTWSVTKKLRIAKDLTQISTHTLTWSVTYPF